MLTPPRLSTVIATSSVLEPSRKEISRLGYIEIYLARSPGLVSAARTSLRDILYKTTKGYQFIWNVPLVRSTPKFASTREASS
jgi:hypothetical protein